MQEPYVVTFAKVISKSDAYTEVQGLPKVLFEGLYILVYTVNKTRPVP
jgi:hypothetical protein